MFGVAERLLGYRTHIQIWRKTTFRFGQKDLKLNSRATLLHHHICLRSIRDEV